ncbi:hypothetical protein GCM10027294_37920 [Marinactinospora endophytica]
MKISGRALLCPYCYSAFPEKGILFRCTGLAGPDGERCQPREDVARLEQIGRREVLPPVFQADGRGLQGVCPDCGGRSDTKVCPVCHTRLPVGFADTRSRMIALVGARDSGKTVFMTVLIHELTHRVGARFGASVDGADDSTRHRFVQDYENPLYGQSRLLAATRRTGLTREPLVFRLSSRRKGLMGERRERTLLSFFDTAGEDLTSEQSVETNLRYLSSADGIILVLDPLQMEGARKSAAPGTRLPQPARPEDAPLHMLERVTDLLMRREGRPGRLLRTPLAVCFTKLDALRHELADGTPLRRPQPAGAYFDEQDSQDVHAQIQQLLHRWDSGRIDAHVTNHYRTSRYFGVSALGESPTGDNRVAGEAVRPYRVADPFLWLLSGFGVVPTRRDG